MKEAAKRQGSQLEEKTHQQQPEHQGTAGNENQHQKERITQDQIPTDSSGGSLPDFRLLLPDVDGKGGKHAE